MFRYLPRWVSSRLRVGGDAPERVFDVRCSVFGVRRSGVRYLAKHPNTPRPKALTPNFRTPNAEHPNFTPTLITHKRP